MEILLSTADINHTVSRMADEITREYREKPLTILGVLNGSLMLLADLVRLINLPLRIGFVQASSYRGDATNPGQLQLDLTRLPDLTGRHVLLIDDIFDTGHTLATLLTHLHSSPALSVRSAVLLWKEGRQQVEIRPDYYGFQIPDRFVVGYGLDYNDEYRNLPYIAVIDEPAP